ncbi:MAG: hydroxymethylglutaryl-CoA lyase, partial [Thermodesulfobacteriota bacterium]|nr:hydroxymethylglutaryl-CoA lyase [Thermodesulfobacteriota bacterium]
RDPNVVGLQNIEDMVVMMDEMGVDTGIDVDRLLDLGTMLEKTIGRRLRSESILNRRIPKAPRDEFKRKGLPRLKEKLGEQPGQKYPADWIK